jgi:hypothetical protein
MSDSLALDVIPEGGGFWRATCECGNESLQHEQDAAWEWLIAHSCLLDLPPD